jgi:hypothetical protein
MLYGFGKPMHNTAGNEISYQAPLHNLHRFGCYAISHSQSSMPPGQVRNTRSKPCMMVGYTHDSKTLWRIWGPEFHKVKAQSEVVFDEERNAHTSCQHESNEIDADMFGLPKDKEYIEEIDTGDEPLRGQDSQPTQLGKRSTSHMHKAPDEEAKKKNPPTDGASAQRIRLPSVRQQKQKTPTAGASAERIRLLSVQQQKQNASPTAGASAERIRLSSVWQQKQKTPTAGASAERIRLSSVRRQ